MGFDNCSPKAWEVEIDLCNTSVFKERFQLIVDNELLGSPIDSILFVYLPFSIEYYRNCCVFGIGCVQSYINFSFIIGWRVGENDVSRCVNQDKVIHATHMMWPFRHVSAWGCICILCGELWAGWKMKWYVLHLTLCDLKRESLGTLNPSLKRLCR